MVSSSHKLAPNAATGAPTRKSKFTIKPVLNPTETIKQLIPEEEDPVLKTEKITFTSYYETWKNFATSVPTDRANCLRKNAKRSAVGSGGNDL